MNRKNLYIFSLLFLFFSCGDQAFLQEAERRAIEPTVPDQNRSGDILIISGGTAAVGTTPFPLHHIVLYSSEGRYLKTLYSAKNADRLWGGDINPLERSFSFVVEGVDRVENIDIDTSTVTNFVLDPQLSGNTMRTLTYLSDGSVIIAESPTVLEKYTADGVRVTAGFPITIPSAIRSVRRISGDRFVVTTTGNPDNPRVYSESGVLQGSFANTVGCNTNCDPYEVVELPDGRFVASMQIAAKQSLELFDSDFSHIGVLYRNLAVLPTPGSLDILANGDLIVCTLVLNACEQLTIDGNIAERVGTRSLISESSLIRQPTTVRVLP